MTHAPKYPARLLALWLAACAVQWAVVPDRCAGQPRRQPDRNDGIYRDRVDPHWFAGNTRFWYRNDLPGDTKEFIRVDAEQGVREPAFDHARLAAALSGATGEDYSADRLPFDEIALADDLSSVLFRVGDHGWRCDLTTYKCAADDSAPAARRPEQDRGRRPDRRRPRGGDGRRSVDRDSEVESPDGKSTAFVRSGNVWLRSGEEEKQLSSDGTGEVGYGMLEWAPDGKTLVAFRIEPGERKEVHLLQSSPRERGRAVLQSRPYPLPGDKFTSYELNLFQVAEGKQVKPTEDLIDFGRPRLRWDDDGHSFTYEKVDRGHQRFRLIEVDAQTAAVRNIIDEQTDTFIWTAHAESIGVRPVTWLEKTDEIIHSTERDGWRHLYLIDAQTGSVKNLITPGEFVVRGVDRIDEVKRQVWFHACGLNPGEDPYFIHHYRVNFDGTGLTPLTEGDGTHTIDYSPDNTYLVDRYERVDMAPVHTLRRASDGKLVCELETADDSELRARGWEPPEVFVAKGRDGKTDIWGIICRPKDFDPNKKYPVIENIYAGPQSAFVPKRFSSRGYYSDLTDLGFVVAKIDGMGTAHRSKAFHDVCWHNLKDAGFPDRILWHKAVAEKYPWYDVSRVGVYGGSAGGQNAMGGLLFHPDFYKVGVAGCGCHDNRMDKASWNEQWMGYPVGPQYAECSNVDNAHRLRGKLLLIVGEMDTNVPPESTYRVVDALVKADKDFDFVMVPGAGHGMGGRYGARRMRDFFVEHLLGEEPPDRNAATGEGR